MTKTEAKNILALAKEKSKRSLFFLAHDVLGFQKINKHTHGEIIKILESESQRKLICIPRGCFKSTLCCIAYPIWLLIRNPNLRILIDSELYTNSKNFIREIKAHLESQTMRILFGNFKGPTWSEGEIIIRQRTKSSPQASITAGGVETQKTGQHFDVIIMDDLNSPSNTNSPENAEKVIQHFKYNHSILDPHGTMLVIGTRYSANDVIGHILQNEDHDYLGAA